MIIDVDGNDNDQDNICGDCIVLSTEINDFNETEDFDVDGDDNGDDGIGGDCIVLVINIFTMTSRKLLILMLMATTLAMTILMVTE